MWLKQSTAAQTRLTPRFVDDTDFKTPETGLTIANTDVKLSKNGGASANKNSGGGTHIEAGRYALTFDATDTNTVGELAIGIVIAGALPIEFKFFVVEEAVYDEYFAASAIGYIADQPVNATKIGGTTQTGRDLGASVLLSSGSGAGQLDFTSGVVKANVTQIDAQATTGNNATLNLKQLNVVNSAGDAIVATSSGSNGNGINASGNGTASGMKLTAGATGDGMLVSGGVTSGNGINFGAVGSGHGFVASGVGTTKHGINATGGSTSSNGINAVGGGTGHGLAATSGSGATGDGIRAVAASTNGSGLSGQGNGGGAGQRVVGGPTGNGLTAAGGSSSGDGLQAFGSAGNSDGISGFGFGTGSGIRGTGGAGAGGDGIEGVAGGGVPIRGDITGNLNGTATTVTNLTNAPTAGDFTATMKTSLGTAVAASAVASVTAPVTVGTNNDKTGYRLSATGVDDIWDEVVEAAFTARQYMRVIASALFAKLSGAATTTVTIRDTGDTKNRVTATVDASGNRTAVSVDGT